jgi:hypothetical protein
LTAGDHRSTKHASRKELQLFAFAQRHGTAAIAVLALVLRVCGLVDGFVILPCSQRRSAHGRVTHVSR